MIKKTFRIGKRMLDIVLLKIKFGNNLKCKLNFNFENRNQIQCKTGKIIIQDNVNIMENSFLLSVNNSTIEIGEKCFFNRNCIVASQKLIKIGSECIFGPNVCIYDHDHAFNAKGFIYNEMKASSIVIEDHCWIGANVTILRGAHIGRGCVIGAGAIIKGNIPPYSLVTSNRNIEIEPLR